MTWACHLVPALTNSMCTVQGYAGKGQNPSTCGTDVAFQSPKNGQGSRSFSILVLLTGKLVSGLTMSTWEYIRGGEALSKSGCSSQRYLLYMDSRNWHQK